MRPAGEHQEHMNTLRFVEDSCSKARYLHEVSMGQACSRAA